MLLYSVFVWTPNKDINVSQDLLRLIPGNPEVGSPKLDRMTGPGILKFHVVLAVANDAHTQVRIPMGQRATLVLTLTECFLVKLSNTLGATQDFESLIHLLVNAGV